MKTTWIHEGSPLTLETKRQRGQSDQSLAWTHVEACLTAWWLSPPDQTSSIKTTWMSGGAEVTHLATYFTNDIGDFAMDLYYALEIAVEASPID